MTTSIIGALDIGGTKLAATIADKNGPLARVTAPTPRTGSERAVAEKGIELLAAACAKAGIDASSVDTVGVSSCGPFVRNDGAIALIAPNLCGGIASSPDLPNTWQAIPLEAPLRERFGHVVIDNDCVAALHGERVFGAVQDEPDCIYVTWSTGAGFGLCVDGHILRGKHGNAGHAGHMLLSDTSDALCGCGNIGDTEALVSGRNLANRFGVSAPDLFGAARDGDTAAQAAVADAARWFGRALYNLTAILDTQVFVIGGSVWNHHGDLLLPLVQPEIDSRMPALTRGVRITSAALGDLVADVGALSLVMPQEWIASWRNTQPWSRLKG